MWCPSIISQCTVYTICFIKTVSHCGWIVSACVCVLASLSGCIKILTCASASFNKLKTRFPPLLLLHFRRSPPTFSPVTPDHQVPPITHSPHSPLASCSSHPDPALFFWPALASHPPLFRGLTRAAHNAAEFPQWKSAQRNALKYWCFYQKLEAALIHSVILTMNEMSFQHLSAHYFGFKSCGFTIWFTVIAFISLVVSLSRHLFSSKALSKTHCTLPS